MLPNLSFLEKIYDPEICFDPEIKNKITNLLKLSLNHSTLTKLPKKYFNKIFNVLSYVKRFLFSMNILYFTHLLSKSSIFKWFSSQKAVKQGFYFLKSAPSIQDSYTPYEFQNLLKNQINKKLADRVRLLYMLSETEKENNNPLLYATYALRIMRLMGKDVFSQLTDVIKILQNHGYLYESYTAEAMFRGAIYNKAQLLQESFDRNLQKSQEEEFLFIDDRRKATPHIISVIVSLYNAESKLDTFLHMIHQQTLLELGHNLEIVLIDSGSPTKEYEVFQKLMEFDLKDASIIYARSSKRETIQHAWNRGIKLSTGKYLTFLGVDEGIHPKCLEILSKELDIHPDIDWVMSDSIVTEVDKEGIYDRDIMIYDRKSYRQDLHYLDCTFLSYVGGLYRKSIHDRFGYYDESFSAAETPNLKIEFSPIFKVSTSLLP